jgi:transposase
MENKVKDLNYSGHKIFVGIDVHLTNWKVSVMLKETPFKTLSIDPNAKALKHFLEKHFPEGEYYSAYEAGFSGFSTHRDLEQNGINNIVVNPADIPTTDKERKQKEDKRDSRKIANTLMKGDLKPIYIPGLEMEALRSLVRYRKTLVREISRNKVRVKAFLYRNGIEIPIELLGASKHWSSNFTKWLQTVRLETDFGHLVLTRSIDTVDHLRKMLLITTKDIKSVIKRSKVHSEVIKNLTSIPGIGYIAAVTLLTEIENIDRFKNLNHLCSFIGLVPSTNSSGDNDRNRGITHRSNKPLREVLVECAWIAIRNDSSLTLVYSSLRKRMEANEAIIRIAKKLLNRIKFVLRNNTTYEIKTNTNHYNLNNLQCEQQFCTPCDC